MKIKSSDRRPPAKRRVRWLVTGVVALMSAAGLAACGGSPKASDAATTSASSTQKAFAAYSSCMKQHGVKLPSNFGQRRPGSTGSSPTGSFPTGSLPTGSFPASRLPAGVSSKKYAAATKACRAKLPAGGFRGGFRGLSNFAAYASCLSDNGVKLSGTGPSALRNLNTSDPTVKAAMQTCSPLLHAGSTTTTTTTG